jgi:hypothetical protein
MNAKEKAHELSEQYAILQDDKRFICPACAEETLWVTKSEDFLAGYRTGLECAAEISEDRARNNVITLDIRAEIEGLNEVP